MSNLRGLRCRSTLSFRFLGSCHRDVQLMSNNNAIDTINHPTMRAVVSEYDYSAKEGLNEPEKAALTKIANQIKGGRILDIGIGAGRTIAPLMAISPDYTGVDYAPEMI